MAATRQDVVTAFDAVLEQYAQVTDLDSKFDLISGDLMRVSNRGYQVARSEKLEGTAPEPVTDPEPVKAEDVTAEGVSDEPTIDLDAVSVKALRSMAKELNIAGGARMKKDELVTAITAAS
jgi:hypothetical protein